MRKFVIGGGPHTGKTTLLEALRPEMPAGTYFIPEPAGIIVRAELARQAIDNSYGPIMPYNDYPTLLSRAIAKSLELENAIPSETNDVVLDRSLIDNIGYARYHGYDSFVPDIKSYIQTAGYTAIFLCDFVGTYDQTLRMGDENYAHKAHSRLTTAYQETGLPVVQVPAMSVSQRVDLFLASFDSLGRP